MTRIQMLRSKKGITLVELLIVVLIIGILGAIASPLYTNYITRARRADAKTALEQVRAAQEIWRAEKGRYSTSIPQLQTTMAAPATTVGYYSWAFTVATSTGFTAQATPFGKQQTDGWLAINQNGAKTSEFPDRWAK
jgi:type IV pilus assembly protein PilE